MSTLDELLEKMRAELPGFIATGIVSIESGLTLGASSTGLDVSVAAASHAELVKSNSRALDLLGLGAQTTEDIVISMKDSSMLIRILGKDYYQGLAVTSRTTLGFARAIMKKYEPLLTVELKKFT